MKSRLAYATFNRGRVSRLALARTDIGRVSMSAEVQTNWFPRVLGSMALRPGMGYQGETRDGMAGVYLPFVYAADDSAIIELTDGALRVWDDGTSLVTRAAVTSAVSNGEFTTDLTDWTDADESGATSSWDAGQLRLDGSGYATAIRRQTMTVVETDTVHALRIVVARGPVQFRVGTSAGLDDLVSVTVLGTGTHSIAFTPSGSSAVIEMASAFAPGALVESIAVEAAGVMELPTPWTTLTAMRAVRFQQVNNVVFCASGVQQRRIERRPGGSWSVVLYEASDGPYLSENTANIRIAASAIRGEITLTASQRIFAAGNVGGLYRLSSQGQRVESDLTAEDTFTNEIRVAGVGAGRTFSVIVAGTWAGTLQLQRSLGEPGSWVDVAAYTVNGTTSYSDGLDNTVAYYRIGFIVGEYTSGTAEVALEYAVGSLTGVARITAVASGTSASAVVLRDLGGTAATEIWAEGAWSDRRGWPTAVAVYEGRLWWAGRSRIWGSVSDVFDSFDPDFEGDAGPIDRFIGEGPVDQVHWLLPVLRLLVGGDAAEHSIRSTSFDEPITPTNFNSKKPSTQGSAPVEVAEVDGRGYFVQRSGLRVYEMNFDASRSDYLSDDMTALIPEIGETGFVRMAVQRQPDTRLICVRTDGTAAMLVRDPAESVKGWIDIETDGKVEDVVVLPGDIEDRVFFMVRRSLATGQRRCHELMAREDQCRGGAQSLCADSHIAFSGASATITGLDHLEGLSVVVWADGADAGTFTVSGGAITLPAVANNACVGLGYVAEFKSAKPAPEMRLGTALTQRKRMDHVGLVLADAAGLEYGPDFDVMDALPLDGTQVEHDDFMIEFPGDWLVDARLCLRATAPKSCTVLAAVVSVDAQEKA